MHHIASILCHAVLIVSGLRLGVVCVDSLILTKAKFDLAAANKSLVWATAAALALVWLQ